MTTNWSLAAAEAIDAAYRAIGEARKNDPEFRALLEADPRAALASKGLEVPQGPEVRVHANDGDTLYVAFPSDPNRFLSDMSLENVSAFPSSAGAVATASTIGSAACS